MKLQLPVLYMKFTASALQKNINVCADLKAVLKSIVSILKMIVIYFEYYIQD